MTDQSEPSTPTSIPLCKRLARGVIGTLLVAATLILIAVVLRVDLGPAVAASWIPMVLIPIVMSLLLPSPHREHRHDFRYGLLWYGFGCAVCFVVSHWDRGRTLISDTPFGPAHVLVQIPVNLAFFSYGVVSHHTSIHDHITGGVLAGISHLRHPNKKLLLSLMFGGFPVCLLLVLVLHALSVL